MKLQWDRGAMNHLNRIMKSRCIVGKSQWCSGPFYFIIYLILIRTWEGLLRGSFNFQDGWWNALACYISHVSSPAVCCCFSAVLHPVAPASFPGDSVYHSLLCLSRSGKSKICPSSTWASEYKWMKCLSCFGYVYKVKTWLWILKRMQRRY